MVVGACDRYRSGKSTDLDRSELDSCIGLGGLDDRSQDEYDNANTCSSHDIAAGLDGSA